MENIKTIRIEDRYKLVYRPRYEIIDLVYEYTDGYAFVWGMNKKNIKNIEKDFIVRLKNTENDIIKYIVEIDKINKENKLNSERIKDIYNGFYNLILIYNKGE